MTTSSTFLVKIEGSDQRFETTANETLLEAGVRHGLGLPYSCRDGVCGSCKARVVTGNIAMRPYQTKVLSDAERENGYILTCCASATSDLTLAVRLRSSDHQVKKMPCRIIGLDRLGDDVMQVRLQIPAAEQFDFLAGQFIDITLKDGTRRSYSLANAPHERNGLVIQIRHMPGGQFSDQLFGASGCTALKLRDILRMEGPQGAFYWRSEVARPVVLIASGTGYAPIRSMLADWAWRHENGVNEHELPPAIHLYWGGRRPQDLYAREEAESWAQSVPNFKFTAVVSDALDADQWSGRTGLVHRAVMADYPNLSDSAVYACGAPVMVAAARQDFEQACGLELEYFYADAFTSAADAITPTSAA